MQVAEAVDAEDVDEHGDEQDVAEEANRVATHVAQEVDGPHEHRDQVDRQHDDTSEHQWREIRIARRIPFFGIWVILFFWRVESFIH